MIADLDATVRQSKKKWAERWLNRKDNDEYLECGKSSIVCKCPRCCVYHQANLKWTGRGMPRIFCGDCRPYAAGMDNSENFCSGSPVARGSRKRAESFFE